MLHRETIFLCCDWVFVEIIPAATKINCFVLVLNELEFSAMILPTNYFPSFRLKLNLNRSRVFLFYSFLLCFYQYYPRPYSPLLKFPGIMIHSLVCFGFCDKSSDATFLRLLLNYILRQLYRMIRKVM